MKIQSSKGMLLYIAGQKPRRLEENTIKNILTLYDTEFLYNPTNLSKELVNKVEQSYGVITLSPQVALCDDLFSVKTEDIECEPECLYCDCPQSSSSSSSTSTCGPVDNDTQNCSCNGSASGVSSGREYIGCTHIVTLNLNNLCCDGTKRKTGKPCFKTFNSGRNGSISISSPPAWFVPVDHNKQNTPGFQERPSLVSGDNHHIAFAKNYESLENLLSNPQSNPSTKLISWGDNSRGQTTIPDLDSSYDISYENTQNFSDNNIGISAAGDTTSIAFKDRSGNTHIKCWGNKNKNYDWPTSPSGYQFPFGVRFNTSSSSNISSIKVGSIKTLKGTNGESTFAISGDSGFIINFDGIDLNSPQQTQINNEFYSYEFQQVNFIAGVNGSIIRPYVDTGSYKRNITCEELIGNKTSNIIASQTVKQKKTTNVNNITIEGKDYPVIFDYNYDMGFGTSYQHPISLGSQSSQTFTSFYNKVAQKESTGIKAKQVYELQVSDNYGITALTTKETPSTGTDNPELVTTSFQNVNTGFSSTLGDNTIVSKSYKKIDKNSSFKVSPSGAFSAIVTNEGKALVSVLPSFASQYKFNIPSDMYFDPRYITVSKDSITLVELNCTINESYLENTRVYTYSDIKAAGDSTTFELQNKSSIESEIRGKSTFIVIMEHISGSTEEVTFQIGSLSGTTEKYINRVLKVSSDIPNIKIYLTEAESSSLSNKIIVKAFLGSRQQAIYKIYTSKINCSGAPPTCT